MHSRISKPTLEEQWKTPNNGNGFRFDLICLDWIRGSHGLEVNLGNLGKSSGLPA